MSGIISYYRPKLKQRIVRGEVPKWLMHCKRKDYIIAAILATVGWVSKEELLEIDRQAKDATKRTGHRYVVDHIIPLKHPRVCGLTVPLNLRVIHWKKNAQKGNGWCEWHGELFPEGEQLHLFRKDVGL